MRCVRALLTSRVVRVLHAGCRPSEHQRSLSRSLITPDARSYRTGRSLRCTALAGSTRVAPLRQDSARACTESTSQWLHHGWQHVAAMMGCGCASCTWLASLKNPQAEACTPCSNNAKTHGTSWGGARGQPQTETLFICTAPGAVPRCCARRPKSIAFRLLLLLLPAGCFTRPPAAAPCPAACPQTCPRSPRCLQ